MMFEFMENAFYIAAGVALLAATALIVFSVSTGIYRAIVGRKHGKR